MTSTNAPGLTRAHIESALDNGQLYWWRGADKFYLCRRIGRTQLWVTRPDEWRVPTKAMFKSYPKLNNHSTVRFHRGPWSSAYAAMNVTRHSPYGDSFIILID